MVAGRCLLRAFAAPPLPAQQPEAAKPTPIMQPPQRGYDTSMADVLYRVSEAEILDLAYFLARLP